MEGDKITHFHGGHEDQVHLQRRVWNLLNKGEVFEQMVQHPTVMTIAGAFLGSEFIMGSVAANRLLPGGPGQEPHVDYPYWDLYRTATFPANINSSFALEHAGHVSPRRLHGRKRGDGVSPGKPTATVMARRGHVPRRAQRKIGKAGDCYIFNGMVWHCAMPNKSNGDRSAILVEYLAKFSSRRSRIRKRCAPRRRRTGHTDAAPTHEPTYPYPQILDEAEATVAYGTKAKS